MNPTHPYNYLFLSDLHLSEGWDDSVGLLHRNEDFFQDFAFAQFVAHHVALQYGPLAREYYQKPWRLVINGDVFDFLQVVSLPEEGLELQAIKGVRTYEELRENDRVYGLGTSPDEVVWKLEQVAQGHTLFFQALAWFLAHEGNELIVMRGNHDIELYWTAVQLRLKDLIAEAYLAWQKVDIKGGDRCPLPRYEDMPDTLNRETLHRAIRFPRLYYYEPGLFYAEHGCQYDPVNSFRNFVEPLLPDNKKLIELPPGSLFVRYFFNKIEEIHPFADNFKPISRYMFWLISNGLSDIVNIILYILPGYLRAWWKAKQKNREKRQFQTPNEPFLRALLREQVDVQRAMRKASRWTTIRMVGSVLLVILSLILLLFLVRMIATASWVTAALILVAVLTSLFASGMMLNSLTKLLAEPYLYQAALRVAGILNGRAIADKESVPYHIFGHDHVASARQLIWREKEPQPSFRQWYVNTGAWIPVFSETDQLVRPAEHLTFFRLVPSRLQDDRDVPELLQWSLAANAPRRVRLLADQRARSI